MSAMKESQTERNVAHVEFRSTDVSQLFPETS